MPDRAKRRRRRSGPPVRSGSATPLNRDGGSDVPVLAVVDVGSRALRMAVAEARPENPTRRLETLSARVSIGVDTFSRGSIRAVTTDAVVKTLHDFALVLKVYGIEPAACRAAATTAVRDARNREVFLDLVESRTGFRIEVIEAIEETRLIYQLATHLLAAELRKGRVLLLGLGAGGTHVILQDDGRIELAETLHFGMLRLRESGGAENAAIRAARRFLAKVATSVDRLHDIGRVGLLVVVNTELFHLVAALAKPRRTAAGLQLGRRAFIELMETLDQMTTQEITDESRLDHAEAELARMAFEEVRAFAVASRAGEVVLPACSMLDSLLLDSRLRLEHAQTVDQSLERSVEAAAWSIARRYRVDQAHTSQVRELALQLFDGLRALTGLGTRSRLLLAVAAILHDAGLYVSTHAHSEHSAYLIANSEVMGLTRQELEQVALVARYHRGPAPNITSLEVGQLPNGARVETLKLIALLRMANALDADHGQRVLRLRVSVSGDDLHVLAETTSGERESFGEIARAFEARAQICDELFGVVPRLTEALVT